jgi:hypothetical protein
MGIGTDGIWQPVCFTRSRKGTQWRWRTWSSHTPMQSLRLLVRPLRQPSAAGRQASVCQIQFGRIPRFSRSPQSSISPNTPDAASSGERLTEETWPVLPQPGSPHAAVEWVGPGSARWAWAGTRPRPRIILPPGTSPNSVAPALIGWLNVGIEPAPRRRQTKRPSEPRLLRMTGALA